MLKFSLEKSFYKPGEIIKGNLNLKTNLKITATSISIHFHGSSRVYWKKGVRSRYTPQYLIAHQKQVTLIEKDFLFSNNNEGFYLNGEFSLSFEIQLPSNIPSSLDGYITYYLRACIHIPWILNKIKHAVEIVKPIDFNMYPHLKQPVTREDT